MTSFEKNLFIDGVHYSLLFCKIVVPHGVKYFVSVCRDKEMPVNFEIEKNGQRWRILFPAPSWVFDVLSKIIEDTDFPE